MLECTLAKTHHRSHLAQGAPPEPESYAGRRREAAAMVHQVTHGKTIVVICHTSRGPTTPHSTALIAR
eukprot:676555-Pyramimonas_sp.AAC.1